MSNPTSNFGWQMPTPTDLVTDLPADFEVFGQAVDTSMADLKGGTTGQILSKATNTDMDFVWIANDQGDITGITATSPLTGGGTSGAVTVGIQSASTSQSGAVQLSDSTSTTSSVLASTPTATKASYDLAAAAIPKSTVTTNGDLIYGTGSATVSRIGVGSTGQVLTVSGGVPAWATPSAGYTNNGILNSSMQIWQRGTSISTSSANTYTADRWATSAAGSASTISRQSTNDTTNLPNIQYCMRFQRNAGQTNTTTYGIYQAFETVNTIPFSGKTITLSFYARAGANYSPTSSLIGIQLFAGTGTDQNPYGSGYTGQTIPINTTQAITTTWTRYSQTVALASTVTEITPSFYMAPTGTAGAADYFEITGVQLEVGSTVTAFHTNQPTYTTELTACQRYYYRITAGQIFGAVTQIGSAQSTTVANLCLPLKTTLRVQPTAVEYANLTLYDGTNLVAAGTITNSGGTNAEIGQISATTTGLTAFRPYWLAGNNNAAAYIGLSAEL